MGTPNSLEAIRVIYFLSSILMFYFLLTTFEIQFEYHRKALVRDSSFDDLALKFKDLIYFYKLIENYFFKLLVY